MVEKRYDHQTGVLHIKSSGGIDIEEMLSEVMQIKQYLPFTKELKILEDAREATAAFTVQELKKLLMTVEEHLKEFNLVKHAVIHTDALATAYAMMTSQIMSTSKYKLKSFSTEAAALGWLNNSTAGNNRKLPDSKPQ